MYKIGVNQGLPRSCQSPSAVLAVASRPEITWVPLHALENHPLITFFLELPIRIRLILCNFDGVGYLIHGSLLYIRRARLSIAIARGFEVLGSLIETGRRFCR
jgi:hypothetical protein